MSRFKTDTVKFNWIIFILTFMLTSSLTHALDLMQAVSPGSLSPSHVSNKMKCADCHDLKGGKPAEKCLRCHDAIANDREKKSGFHGQGERAVKECATCHKEHKKPSRLLPVIDKTKFNHLKETRFNLQGFHSSLDCAKCHTKPSFRLSNTNCNACHQDAHKKAFDQNCTMCHSPSVHFKTTIFDHSKRTKFKLLGKHAEQKCSSCHLKTQKPGQTCYDCHAAKDAHKGMFGQDCSKCHNPTGWKNVSYDHNAFKLTGKHQSATCSECHAIVQPKREGRTNCSVCHIKDDAHKGQRGDDCGRCHDTSDFKMNFDHGKRTGFKLEGQHASLECEKCHLEGKSFTRSLSRKCSDCHAKDDAHKGSFGQECVRCHTTHAWKRTTFNHKRETGFALANRHAILECTACHTAGFSKHPSADCSSCHQKPASHISIMEQDCTLCHSDRSFILPRYSHPGTGRLYSGRHLFLNCTDCHKNHNFTSLGRNCNDCHLNQKPADTLHNTYASGKDCGECHVPFAWSKATFAPHNSMKVKLQGRHATLGCSRCHNPDWTKKGGNPAYTDCAYCHYGKYNQDEGRHTSIAVDSDCSRCHSYNGFGGN